MPVWVLFNADTLVLRSALYTLHPILTFETYFEARFEKDIRYYVIRLTKDLLEDWVIVLINGRIKSKLGQSRTLDFSHFNEAYEDFCTLAKVRHLRKYGLKTVYCENPMLLHLLSFLTTVEPDKDLAGVVAIKKMNPNKASTKKTEAVRNSEPYRDGFAQISFSF